MTAKSGNQLNLPGVDVSNIRINALLETNPTPKTKQEAEAFFRNRCVATLTMKGDHDVLRVVLKNTNTNEDALKLEQKSELPIADQFEWEVKFIETAAAVHGYWLELERKKY